MDLAIALVPQVPERIATHRQFQFLYEPIAGIADAEAKMRFHDETFFQHYCERMSTINHRRWMPVEQCVIARRISPAAMSTARARGASLGILYVYVCIADAIEERWHEDPGTLISLPRYGPHVDAAAVAMREQHVNEGALQRFAPDLAQGVRLLVDAHGIEAIRAVADIEYGLLRWCAAREPYVPFLQRQDLTN